LKHSQIVPFGSTRRKDIKSEDDKSLIQLLKTGSRTVVIFGKSWNLQVEDILKTTLEENLRMISSSIDFLRKKGIQVIFDAEHYFDGFKADPDYALETIRVATKSGARTVVLCDTNGGTLTYDLEQIVVKTKRNTDAKLGIHCHNDSGLAVANTITAVHSGVSHVQGTINGFGERCGNADLCQVIPTLKFKMGLSILGSDEISLSRIKDITNVSRYVYELANIPPNILQPYVGIGAFAHKAGMHVDAITKNSGAYEHINPELIGNKRRLLISELAGKAGIIKIASEYGLQFDNNEVIENILIRIKALESEGYHLENADATMFLIMMKEMGKNIELFKVKRWEVFTSKETETTVRAKITVDVKGTEYEEVGEGVGPVHSLDLALRKALLRRFPELEQVSLVNYKVTVVEGFSGTSSSVRVFIEFRNNGYSWAATSVSRNITEASEIALSEGYIYWLLVNSHNRGDRNDQR